MKRAALYARVSSDLQKKEKTIESQIAELKKQIENAGDMLVKEYTDDGFSGARLDRPAMNQLRADLKKDVFETIYFLNTDRIAREVTYQTIIIGEILKHKKQIIINGKDYVENPENKFTLQVLGAVSELERAKIIERSLRGKQHKLEEGFMMSGGSRLFGYNYIHKTQTSPARLEINEKEANIVRFVFTEYATGNKSMNHLSRRLEDMGAITKTGKKLWGYSAIQNMLKQRTYIGVRYYNRLKTVTEYLNPLSGAKPMKKLVPRDKADWIGISVPTIISKEIFDKVQVQLEWNRKRYRNPPTTKLLSSLVKCGYCGASFYGYQRYFSRKLKDGTKRIHHKIAYRCQRHMWRLGHSKNAQLPRCESRERMAHLLEKSVFNIIEEIMTDPEKLTQHIEILKTQRPRAHMEREFEKIKKRIRLFSERKQRIIDLYANGQLPREEYVAKNRAYDIDINILTERMAYLQEQVPLFRKTELIETAVHHYCTTIKLRLKKCVDFETKRQFLLDYINKVIYRNDKIALCGSVPISVKSRDGEGTEIKNLEFQIAKQTGLIA